MEIPKQEQERRTTATTVNIKYGVLRQIVCQEFPTQVTDLCVLKQAKVILLGGCFHMLR